MTDKLLKSTNESQISNQEICRNCKEKEDKGMERFDAFLKNHGYKEFQIRTPITDFLEEISELNERDFKIKMIWYLYHELFSCYIVEESKDD